jgi:hypothetical protein
MNILEADTCGIAIAGIPSHYDVFGIIEPVDF